MRRAAFALSLLTALACNNGPVPASSSGAPAETPDEAPANPRAEAAPAAPTADNPHASAENPHTGASPRVPLPANPEMVGGGIDPERPVLAGITWEAPSPFVHRAPRSQMRAAEYVVEGPGGEALMTVFHFPGMGGTIDANIERWIGQFAEAARGSAQRDAREQNGLRISTVDISGAYAGMQMMGGGQARQAPAPDQRLLGAIVVGSEGPIFFKLTGPRATVDTVADAFAHLVDSFDVAAQ